MLDVTVDLVPGGFESHRRTIATMKIANISDLAETSNYRVEATEGRNDLANLPSRRVSFIIERHDRAQSVWDLITKAARIAAKAKHDSS